MRSLRQALVATAVATLPLVFCGSASAVEPVKGGRYTGHVSYRAAKKISFETNTVAFNVDDAGRTFASDPRVYFEGSWLALPCARRAWDLGGTARQNGDEDFYTVTDGAAVRIAGGGRFSLSSAIPYHGVSKGLRLRVRGRFTRRGKRASGSIVVATRAPGARRCNKRGTFSAKFSGQRHLAHGTCSPAKTKTIADDGIRRIYRERYVEDPAIGRYPARVIYACDRRTKNRWFLAPIDTNEDYALAFATSETFIRAWLQGDVVALSVAGCSTANCVPLIRIVDLRTGAPAFNEDAGGDGAVLDNASVESLVLKPNGSAAWTFCQSRSSGDFCRLVKEESFGPTVIIDEGIMDPHSLTLDGSSLSYRNNGATKSTTLN